MTARRQTFLALPPERIHALRRLAEAKGTTMADLVGELLLAEIERGTIADETPGVVACQEPELPSLYRFVVGVAKDGGTYMMALLPISRATLRRVADVLEAVATGGLLKEESEGNAQTTRVGRGYSLTVTNKHMDEPWEMQFARVGAGVVVAQGAHRRVFAPSVALDIVRQIRKAAGESPIEETAKAA